MVKPHLKTHYDHRNHHPHHSHHHHRHTIVSAGVAAEGKLAGSMPPLQHNHSPCNLPNIMPKPMRSKTEQHEENVRMLDVDNLNLADFMVTAPAPPVVA